MLASGSAVACSLCGNMSGNTSLAFEFSNADVVVYGHLANPKLAGGGKGTTEFHIDRTIKNNSVLLKKVVTIDQWLPVLDPKSPPKYVMFYRTKKIAQIPPGEEWDPICGRLVSNPAVLDFAAELAKLQTEPAKKLLHAAKHFDDPDPNIANEAFMVFAKADDKLIAETAKQLSPAVLRKLVKDADTEPERLSMFAFLLGACGNADDAEVLGALVKNPTPRMNKSYEGILAGYIMMRPKEGWAAVETALQNSKQSFLLRYAALRTVRFFYNARSAEFGPQVMQALALAIAQPDIADIAINDLCEWKRWDHTKLVLACWDRKTHDSAITKQSIVRYALTCPSPEARTFMDRARREDPETVRAMQGDSK